jgi:hypothetical protein
LAAVGCDPVAVREIDRCGDRAFRHGRAYVVARGERLGEAGVRLHAGAGRLEARPSERGVQRQRHHRHLLAHWWGGAALEGGEQRLAPVGGDLHDIVVDKSAASNWPALPGSDIHGLLELDEVVSQLAQCLAPALIEWELAQLIQAGHGIGRAHQTPSVGTENVVRIDPWWLTPRPDRLVDPSSHPPVSRNRPLTGKAEAALPPGRDGASHHGEALWARAQS